MSIRDRLKEIVDIVDEEEALDEEEILEEEEVLEEEELPAEVEEDAEPPPDKVQIPVEELQELLGFLDKKNRLVAEFAQVALHYENAKESIMALLKISENELKNEISRIRTLCGLPKEVKYHLTLPTKESPVGSFSRVDD